MSNETIIWDEPPNISRSTGYGKWAKKLEPFRDRPMEWGRFPDIFSQNYAYNLATRINTGKVSGAEPGEFEATARMSEDGEGHHVHVRYVGA